METPIEFIKLLKSQHRSIISIINEIDNQQGGPNDIKKSIDKLNAITDLLFDHLEKEDKQLYPVLINNSETSEIGKKYFYDMERLSCIAVDFFKRYCVNREGLKIFVEDFINGYSLFRGLLRVRIKREETELYPAFILLESGVIYSEVMDFVQDKESALNNKKKTILVFGKNQPNLEVMSLALEMNGYKVSSTRNLNQISDLCQKLSSDLILVDIDNSNNELIDLVKHLKNEVVKDVPIVGYSTTDKVTIQENLNKNLDHFILKPAIDVEAFSERVKHILTKSAS